MAFTAVGHSSLRSGSGSSVLHQHKLRWAPDWREKPQSSILQSSRKCKLGEQNHKDRPDDKGKPQSSILYSSSVPNKNQLIKVYLNKI